MRVGQKVICTDGYGNYRNEKGTVIKMETNIFGIPLIIVKLEKGTEACFYTHEVKETTSILVTLYKKEIAKHIDEEQELPRVPILCDTEYLVALREIIDTILESR